mmetsp:Transcript_20833/g.53171  ORF Transcript_20833/g.53171 Transcript_20833/m.53171 type:complete len:96 (-) Transcript_20833:187-474(-)
MPLPRLAQLIRCEHLPSCFRAMEALLRPRFLRDCLKKNSSVFGATGARYTGCTLVWSDTSRSMWFYKRGYQQRTTRRDCLCDAWITADDPIRPAA